MLNNQPIRSPTDATCFLAWIDKVYESAANQVYLTDAERDLTLFNIQEARKIFEKRK